MNTIYITVNCIKPSGLFATVFVCLLLPNYIAGFDAIFVINQRISSEKFWM